jgi:hypothetical protein
VGTVLGIADASDPDGDPLTYSGGDADGVVGVAEDGTIALVQTVPNREVTIEIVITVSDGTDTANAVCPVTVTAVSGAGSARVYGSRTAGHVVFTVPDEILAVGPLTVTARDDDGLFAVDADTGVVTVVDTLPRPALHATGADREQTYEMDIEAGAPDGVVEWNLTILVVDFFDDDHSGDVSTTPYETSINWMGDAAVAPWLRPVTSGCTAPDKIAPVYCPENGTLRGQMAVFVTRMAMVADESAAWDNSDADVIEWADTVGHRFSRWIVAMREAGFTDGCNQGTGFCPERVITWGEASVFILRAFGPTIDGSDGLGVSQPDALQWLIDSGLTGDLLAADRPSAADTNTEVPRGVMARVLHTVGTEIGAPTPG